MSEDEARRIAQQDEEGAEVDAHLRRVNDDPTDELRREDDDDVEAHRVPKGV
jgi:hypothetical protein